ncbi:hypothetical protein [Haloarcula pelagica]|uniref:hypothetical protein n=1 Tax=Haloarcula pelagica TaxID=3033389 RepID=UPI0024C3EB14|nr:hypothetical protein [Halomicroarcula sp. YJ-61-S]
MSNKRRKDTAHDVGDSMPGTVGDSKGTIHDRQGGPSFDPEDVEVPGENNTQSNQQHEHTDSQKQTNKDTSTGETNTEESTKQSKRMKYAKKYGESWPVERQRRFLEEHDVSAKDMGWRLTE